MPRGTYRSSYDRDGAPRLADVEGWARRGLSAAQIAKNLGIATSTLYVWRDNHPELAEALARGREVSDLAVENALFKRACGYTAEVKKHYKVKNVTYDPVTGKRLSETEELVPCMDQVHVPGDVEAQKWWLSNRDRPGERWRYKPDSEPPREEGEETGVVVLAPVDAEPTPPPELVAEMAAQSAQRERVAGEVS